MMDGVLVCRICRHEWRFNGADWRCPVCGSTLVEEK